MVLCRIPVPTSRWSVVAPGGVRTMGNGVPLSVSDRVRRCRPAGGGSRSRCERSLVTNACDGRCGVDSRIEPGMLQSRVPCAVAGRNVLGPVARDRQAERQQAGEGEALGEERRRIFRPTRRSSGGKAPSGGALQAAQPPQARSVQRRGAQYRHHHVQGLPRAEREPVGGVVPEEVDEEARERVPEDEASRHSARRSIDPPHVEQVRHQQQVLGPVVQHHGMAEALRVGELHRPPDIGRRADDLAVDEVSDPSHAHQESGRNDERVRHEQEGLPVAACEQRGGERSAEQQPVRRHAAEPPGRNQVQVIAVEGPFVEGDLDRASAHQHAGGDEQAQAPHLAGRQPQFPPTAPEEQMQLDESEGETEAVPPEVDAADVEQYRVETMCVRSEHVSLLRRAWLGGR